MNDSANANPILWLGEAGYDGRELVGGKAAALSRLAVGYPVPPGFCLTAPALGDAGDAAGTLPPSLADAVAAAYRKLAERCGEAAPRVAVRSSAIGEDGPTASFAGQHETILNLVGAPAVLAAVTRCIASARTPRALAYRVERGLDDTPRIAVLVQQLVAAEVSAVALSAHPVSGARGEVVINATWGLGESLVGGSVTPDSWTVRKADLAIIGESIADKARMTVVAPETGGTHEVAVPRFLRAAAALDAEQIGEIARLACTLEAEFGWPVDLECAYDAERRLFLLQCRPITTLANSAGSSPGGRDRSSGERRPPS